MADELNVKVAVNSVISHSRKSIPILVESLLLAGFKETDILIVEGGYTERTVEDHFGLKYIKTNHNSIDFTGLIEIVEHNIPADYWFYVHDTSAVGKNFRNILLEKLDTNYQKIALYDSRASMNIGAYKFEYLMRHRNYLLTKKNTDYSRFSILEAKRVATMQEDLLLWKLGDTPCGCFGVERLEPTPPENLEYLTNVLKVDLNPVNVELYGGEQTIVCYRPYGEEFAPRLIEYYKHLDFYKFKSNYGANNPTGDREKFVINL